MTPDASLKPKEKPKSALDHVLEGAKQKEAEGAKKVYESAAGVQSEVSEVMAGVEKPKEGVSERKSEGGQQGDLKTGKVKQDDTSGAQGVVASVIFPAEEKMIKLVRFAIEREIETQWKKAKKLESNLNAGNAQEYNSAIANIRSLKEVLANMFSATFDYLKGLYLKYCTTKKR